MGKRITVVVPAYNESACVHELARRLAAVFDAEPDYEFDAIIVENGSIDDTWDRLRDVRRNDQRFRLLRLARNFRMDGGLTAGLEYVDADACILMAADLQDPPEMIHDFLRAWEEGYSNVYGIVTERGGTGPIRRLNSRAFYMIAGKLTDGRIPKNASDFRLLDRQAYESVRSMRERNRFVRGLVAWTGYSSIGIEMKRPQRFGGVSNADTTKVVDLAVRGILAHSVLPLRMITVLGLTLSTIALVSIVVLTVVWIVFGVPFAGFGTLVGLLLLAFGFLFVTLGVLAEYLGLIYEEVKQRPNFIIAEREGL